MGEQVDDQDMNNTEIAFDNLTILKELGNIINLVRTEDFLDTVPKVKLGRVKWTPMFNCLKQTILSDMIEELSTMWKYENMSCKIEVLEKQKEKFVDMELENILWRPQLGDVKAQLRAKYAANLKKQIILTESLAKEHEARVSRLQKTIIARRGYLKALQLDIQKYQKRNDELVSRISDKLNNHNNFIRGIILDDKSDVEICWKDKDLEINEIKK